MSPPDGQNNYAREAVLGVEMKRRPRRQRVAKTQSQHGDALAPFFLPHSDGQTDGAATATTTNFERISSATIKWLVNPLFTASRYKNIALFFFWFIAFFLRRQQRGGGGGANTVTRLFNHVL